MHASGKVFLVTGSTDGIGRHTAESLARLGAQVLLHGRSEARVQQAVRSIQEATSSRTVHGYTANFASMAAIRRLAEQLRREHPKIDCLINNAGVYETERKLSEDGFEMTWQVNVIAPFLLTSLLLESISERIVNVSSISASGHIDFGNLQQERGYSAHNAYGLSKLCSMLFTYQLARRLEQAGSSVTCNCLDPGTVNTKMLYAGWGPIGMRVEDADDELALATNPSLASVTGAYFVSKSKTKSPAVSYDAEVQQRLWRLLEEQTGAVWSV